MKKALAILLLASYLLCAFGINISFHHCAGEIKYVNVHSDKKKTCCKGKKMPKNCCQTVKITYSKTDDKNQTFIKFIPKIVSPIKAIQSFPSIASIDANKFRVASVSNYRLRPPPLRPAVLPLYIVHSVYRI